MAKTKSKRAPRPRGVGKVTPPLQLPKEWPASKVEVRKVSELVPYARNARTHTDSQVSQVADSIARRGWTNPVLVDEGNGIIAGHCRVLAAEKLGLEAVPVLIARGWSEEEKRAYVLADNRLALEAGWDPAVLALELGELRALDFDLKLTGFGDQEVQRLLFDNSVDPLTNADGGELPEVRSVVVSKPGDVWIMGRHRLTCGDSTRADDVARAMGEDALQVDCVIADPPYGMGKEKEGIANDNLYREKLDAFQMAWWRVARERLAENGSVYLWGNAPDLWRLWYVGGLSASGDLLVRNELVWDKGTGFGMRSEGQHSYPPATERCLFLMRGQQFLGNQNKEDYWEGWEPLRLWLVEQRDRAGWKVKEVNRITGTHMAGHWFGRSQFQPISREHYATLQQAADGAAFVESYDELFGRLFPELRDGGNEHRRQLSERVRESRTYFDNAHAAMTDVWQFPRVHGEERFGHATPKPTAMIGRCVRSSVPEEGVVFDPFSGTGTVTIACELLGRACRAVELEPAYVDVAVRRWQQQAGESAILENEGRTFAAVEAKRAKP